MGVQGRQPKAGAVRPEPGAVLVLAVIDANPGINQLAIASALDIERAGSGVWSIGSKRRAW
jgi:hypothetical protein